MIVEAFTPAIPDRSMPHPQSDGGATAGQAANAGNPSSSSSSLSTCSLRARVPCKINLFLEVLGTRLDGYHDLDTVMMAVSLCDDLEIHPRLDSEISLQVDLSEASHLGEGLLGGHRSAWSGDNAWKIPSDRSNLVCKALEMLRQRLGIDRGADVVLRKRIPSQAGLGGGSADAAAALVLASLHWTGLWEPTVACEIASNLGSDLNFFLEGHNGVAYIARCSGRGERVQPIASNLKLWFVLVHPPQGCDTGAIFRKLKETDQQAYDATGSSTNHRSPESLMSFLSAEDAVGIGAELYNRLEKPAASSNEWIERTASRFDRYNPLGHCLSGSGSTRFCLCRTHEEAEKIASELRSFRDMRVYTASTWSSPSIFAQTERLNLGS
ncbi:MAG: hypothetical protein FJ308_10415 [Planctomycetes bacterium]|nr:hypothetical protein [Planctomycetota bacterium]